MKEKVCILSTRPGNNIEMIEFIILTRPWWKKQTNEMYFNLHYEETTPQFTLNSSVCIFNHMPDNMKYHSKWRLYEALEKTYGNEVFHITKPTFLYSGIFKKQFEEEFKWQATHKGVKLPGYDGCCKNIWIMKPISMNRGRGISLVKNLEEAENHQKEFPNTSFLVEQYIERPMLYNNRKFDIRCYSLITASGNGFIYQEGYLRLCSVEYNAESDSLTTHLTNNEYQKFMPEYSTYEEGNMISFKQYDEYTEGQFLSETWPEIRRIMKQTQISIGNIQGTSVNCFELLGFDFMLEQTLEEVTPVLIEVNMNPCMKLASPVSWSLLPFMIDDLLELTIDKTFVPPEIFANEYRAKKEEHIKQGKIYQIKEADYYKSEENRKFTGLRWEVLQGGDAVERSNGFEQTMQNWKEYSAIEKGDLSKEGLTKKAHE